jgi:hypothetical protein
MSSCMDTYEIIHGPRGSYMSSCMDTYEIIHGPRGSYMSSCMASGLYFFPPAVHPTLLPRPRSPPCYALQLPRRARLKILCTVASPCETLGHNISPINGRTYIYIYLWMLFCTWPFGSWMLFLVPGPLDHLDPDSPALSHRQQQVSCMGEDVFIYGCSILGTTSLMNGRRRIHLWMLYFGYLAFWKSSTRIRSLSPR